MMSEGFPLSNFSSNLLKVVKFIIFICLSICCTLQVWDIFSKFFKRQTSYTSQFIDAEALELPAISICPGLKNLHEKEELSYDTIYDPFDIINENATEKDVLSFWHNSTYSINDIVPRVKKWELSGSVETAVKVGFNPEINATIHEVSTVYGRCYSFHFHSNFSASDYVSLHINFAHREYLHLLFHEPFAEIGHNFNYWATSVASRRMNRNKWSDTSLHLTVRKRIHNCVPDIDYNRPKCIFEWAEKAYLNNTCKNSTARET